MNFAKNPYSFCGSFMYRRKEKQCDFVKFNLSYGGKLIVNKGKSKCLSLFHGINMKMSTAQICQKTKERWKTKLLL